MLNVKVEENGKVIFDESDIIRNLIFHFGNDEDEICEIVYEHKKVVLWIGQINSSQKGYLKPISSDNEKIQEVSLKAKNNIPINHKLSVTLGNLNIKIEYPN